MAANQCVGNPTFNEVTNGAISEWPDNLPGLICKTPPFGTNSASRFAQCCSGPVYNITSPTSADDPAYPVSCATLCQMDPALNKFNNKYPYHWSDHFMCLTDGGTEASDWDVVCDTVTVKGDPAPTSFIHTPTGPWQTSSYALDSWGFPEPTAVSVLSNVQSETTAVSSTRSSTPTATSTGLSETALPSTSVLPSISSSPPSSPSPSPSLSGTGTTTAPVPTTSTSNGGKLNLKNASTALLAVSMLCIGWGSL
ncbi:uncharacterized protein TRUGW13939_10971 [Talaromyces rugulosus]|uniref:Uncharacterized protein n=1 Tax=Talaromyces rugulosus TaxID=121627 RepID=A0A7H8RBI1_TALRU|nr:uncharacterized protein TRUGW13939_10971 [Talaromyces rugulosus]QKX63800.1 hypothetical protein TRUGW13939_10971 [Talaromyces rugulosus]